MKLVIFGCGKIAKRIAASCKLVKEIELVGFASKDVVKAKEYAQTYDCLDYGDYDHFLNNPEIDGVYVATYNLSHFELIEKCIRNHKSVLCEKPMVSSYEEVNYLFDLAKEYNVTLMEAMKAVFLPINIHVKKMIEEKTIGEIIEAHASFTRGEDFDYSHWIFDKKTGGALKDVGSYCAGILNYLFDSSPEIIRRVTDDSELYTNRTGEVWLQYGNVKAHIKASNEFTEDSCLIIKGSTGMIRVDNFWKSGEGIYTINGKKYKLKEELISDFYYELKHFAYLVDSNVLESPIMSRLASIKILKITCGGNKE